MAVGSDKASLLIDAVLDRCGQWRDIFATIGLGVVCSVSLKFVWKLSRTVWIHYGGGTAKQQQALLLKSGQWAIINNCNDDLGKEFAIQLAQLGIDLILIAPDDKQLTSQFVEELVSRYNIQCVKIYLSPGSNKELAFYDDIVQCVEDKMIALLIHNMQSVISRSVVSLDGDEDALIRHVNANLFSVTMLTNKIVQNCFLPRRRGYVVFINGAIQYQSLGSPVMLAAKTYINSLANRLHSQLKARDVHVQLLTPCGVCPKSHPIEHSEQKPSFFVPSVSVYVNRALGTIGRTDRSTGYFPHTVQMWLTPNERCFMYMRNVSHRLRLC